MKIQYNDYVVQIIYLLSLSTIVTSAVASSPSWRPNGSEFGIIIILNISSLSDLSSSFIDKLNEEQIAPAGNVTT